MTEHRELAAYEALLALAQSVELRGDARPLLERLQALLGRLAADLGRQTSSATMRRREAP